MDIGDQNLGVMMAAKTAPRGKKETVRAQNSWCCSVFTQLPALFQDLNPMGFFGDTRGAFRQ
jgi:hypothetical protein